MQFISTFFNRRIFWLTYNHIDQLPDKDWICLFIANKQPDIDKFDKFIRTSISRNILEFKAHGEFGEKLHDLFDETIALMETMENYPEIDVMTTWHNGQTLEDAFWQCFFASCILEKTDNNNICIICIDADGVNRMEELKGYIKDFELGWIPSNNYKHDNP